jgi:hypothetical protein
MFGWRRRRFDKEQLQRPAQGGDNPYMPKTPQREGDTSAAPPPYSAPFAPGSIVVVTLGSPRDKFWGMILALAPEGLSMSGLEMASFEDFVVMVKDGESFTLSVVFFPMHRIERIELDLPDESLPSLSQRFSSRTGLDPKTILDSPVAREKTYSTSSLAVRVTKDPA